MSRELDELSKGASELAEKFPKLLGDIIRANVQSLSTTAAIIRAYEEAFLKSPDTEKVLNIVLSEMEEPDETPEAKKARILAIEDPLIKFREVLSIVRAPNIEERDILKQHQSLHFDINAKSLGKFVTENEAHFNDEQIDHLNTVPAIRDFTPPVDFFIAFLNPNQIYLQDSNHLSQKNQAKMIKDFSDITINPILPNALAIMLPAVAYAQADWYHFNRDTTRGQKLFKDFRARTAEGLLSGTGSAAGRISIKEKLLVHTFETDKGFKNIYAIPAIVFV